MEPTGHESLDPGLEAARHRSGAVLDGLSRIDLGVIVVAPPDETRLVARRVATSAAIAAGRGPLLDEAQSATRESVLDSFARSGFSGTWAATQVSMSVAGPADRLAAAAAFEEAAMAAVVEDLAVDADSLDVLRSTSRELTGLGALPMPGSLSSIASGVPTRGPLRAVVLVAFSLAVVAIAFTGTIGIGLVALAVGASLAGALSRRSSRHVDRHALPP